MDQQYKREKRILSEFCQAQGLHYSDKREAVLKIFLDAEHHLTADDLQTHMKQSDISMDRKTVQAALDVLVSSGLARQLRLQNGNVVYEHAFAHKHHDHLVCRRCNTMIEFTNPDIERLQENVAAKHGFAVENHALSIYGVCKRCTSKTSVASVPTITNDERAQLTSLDKLKPGQVGTVRDVNGGKDVIKRLAAMGIRPGKALTKVSSMLMRGPVVVSIDQRQLAIGHGMACKVMVDASS